MRRRLRQATEASMLAQIWSKTVELRSLAKVARCLRFEVGQVVLKAIFDCAGVELLRCPWFLRILWRPDVFALLLVSWVTCIIGVNEWLSVLVWIQAPIAIRAVRASSNMAGTWQFTVRAAVWATRATIRTTRTTVGVSVGVSGAITVT